MSCSTLFSSETVMVVDSDSKLLVSPFGQSGVELSIVALSFTPDEEAMIASAGISGTGDLEMCSEDDSASSTGGENRMMLRANDDFEVGGASCRCEVRVTGSSFEGLLWLTIGNFFFFFFRRLLLSR